MNDILDLKGEDVFIDEGTDDLSLDEHEFHVKDIIGLTVINLDVNKELGKVTDVMFTGANDVWVIEGDKEYLIHYIKEVVKTVDLHAGIDEITQIEEQLDTWIY